LEGGELATTAQDIVSHVRRSAPDAIDIALPWQRWDEIKTLSEAFRAVPLPVRLIPDSTAAEILGYRGRRRPTEFAVELQREPLTSWELRSKRALDLLLAGAALFVLSPLFLAIAIAVRLDAPGPVLFQQRRRGFNGQMFAIYKFRSMSVLENGTTIRQATRDDPRVTRVGRWLRRSSLDELPQLINVLRGDMSLVGPRPHAVAHDDQYTRLIANYAFRHHVKPGITGWAQVNGFRGETPTVETMQRRIDHDLWYIANWSFWGDLLILLRTGLHLFRAPNAY
jgi:Undecaprenyl-phosphate glucose phosphotransferase